VTIVQLLEEVSHDYSISIPREQQTHHVWRDKDPLWDLLYGQVGPEVVKTLDLRRTIDIVGDAVKVHQWVVFSDVIIGKGVLVRVVEPWVARVRKVFLVFAPGNAFGVQKINHSGDVLWNSDKFIMVHAEVITTHDSGIIGL